MKYAGQFIRVRNLDRYQHYKDRNPPWIKLHQELLEDYDFSCLQDASKAHALCIMLLASRLGNRIPADPKWIARKINATSPVDLEALLSCSFLEVVAESNHDASEQLATCEQPATLETEGETEKRTTLALVPAGQARRRAGNQLEGFAEWYAAYPRKKARGDAEKAWRDGAASRPPLTRMLVGLKTSIAEWTKEKRAPDKIPYPARYLRTAGWDDEPDLFNLAAGSNGNGNGHEPADKARFMKLWEEGMRRLGGLEVSDRSARIAAFEAQPTSLGVDGLQRLLDELVAREDPATHA